MLLRNENHFKQHFIICAKEREITLINTLRIQLELHMFFLHIKSLLMIVDF